MTDVMGGLAGGATLGTVATFDDDRGLGTVRADDGRELPFHCTALVDGTRQVAVGTRVRFVTAAGHLGRTEARELATIS